MTNKKFLSISFVTALLSVVIALNACKKDDPADNPADEGKKAAQELCDCLNNAQNEQAEAACFSQSESKYKKYENTKAFENTFNQEIGGCSSYLTYLGAKAAQDLCECFATTEGDPQAEWACVFGLQSTIYGNYMEDEVFGDAFTNELMVKCSDVLAWLYENIYGN